MGWSKFCCKTERDIVKLGIVGCRFSEETVRLQATLDFLVEVHNNLIEMGWCSRSTVRLSVLLFLGRIFCNIEYW